MQIPMIVFVSHMTDGTVHRDVYPAVVGEDESTAELRALSGMMLRETGGNMVDRWDAYHVTIEYDEHA